MKIAVTDTSVFIDLFAADLVSVFFQLPFKLHTTIEVGAVSERKSGRFPAQVWFIDKSDRIFEAQQEWKDSGVYHGYQLVIPIPKGLKELYHGI